MGYYDTVILFGSLKNGQIFKYQNIYYTKTGALKATYDNLLSGKTETKTFSPLTPVNVNSH